MDIDQVRPTPSVELLLSVIFSHSFEAGISDTGNG